MIIKKEKVNKLSKYHIIYPSKLNSNVIGPGITRKTCNLTQNRAQNDPLNCQIKAFHSTFQK